MNLGPSQLLDAKRQLDLLLLVRDGVFTAAAAMRAKGYVAVPIDILELEAVVACDGKKVFVLFQGTENTSDALRDLDFKLEETLYGKIHKGFFDAWTTIAHEVHSAIDTVCPEGNKPLVVAGHSLGAALAILCMQDLDDQGYSITDSYLFGCPRVGDKGWASHFEARELPIISFANDNDIVTMVPFFSGYTHVGKHAYLDRNGDITSKRKISMALLIYSWWIWAIMSVKDHLLTTYNTYLEKALERVGWYG